MTKLLLVDDDPLLRETLARALGRAGYDVLTAENGRAALAQLDTDPVDVIVLDILMPEQEGIETIMALRRRPKAPTIIAMSGGGTQLNMDVLSAAQKLGADYTLAKPFTPKELIALLDRATRSRAKQS